MSATTPIPEIGSRTTPPHSSIADAVGRHHDLKTAIADLVDNSIDAGATLVRVRFLSAAGEMHGLRVIDDGRGMDSSAIDAAMTFAQRREYASSDLGHFGLGLKAASLSQADEFDVLSKALGAAPVGRRLRSSAATRVVELDPLVVGEVLASSGASVGSTPASCGTVVEWRRVKGFLSSPDRDERAQWLEATFSSLAAHLGLVFHRLLGRGRISIVIDDFDTGIGAAGAPRTVNPIDPFACAPGTPAEQRHLDARLADTFIPLRAMVWPGTQQNLPTFRLRGRPGGDSQGLYIYRHDRLLQAGGWSGLAHSSPDLALARVAVELDGEYGRHVVINPEKSGVELDPDARSAVQAASDGRTDFRDFLAESETAAGIARRRNRRPITLVEVDRGLTAPILDALSAAKHPVGVEPIAIRWRASTLEAPIEVDLEHRTLWLNSRYRSLLGSRSERADDAPFVKTLLLLLCSRFFEGSVLGARERGELTAWMEILTVALDEQLRQQTSEGARAADA